MKTIRERRDIMAPIEAIFDFAQDQVIRMSWDPYIREPHRLLEALEGTEIEVQGCHGLRMKCKYLKVDRPHLLTIKMVDGPWFLEKFAATWRFMPIEEKRTAVVLLYNFEMKQECRWLQHYAEVYFRWDMKRRLKALREECEQNEVQEIELVA